MNWSNWSLVLFPFLKWLPRVNRKTFRDDLTAGLTGGIIALPQGVAFATIAGMPPEYGLYAGMIPAIVAALFGSSWHLVSGPTTAASIVIFSVLSQHAEPGSPQYVQLALTLTIMVGAIQLSMGLVRFGTLVNFISHSVIVGFTAGAAILIAASQLKHFFGLLLPRGGNFYETIHTVISHWSEINPYATAVGLVTMITGLLIKRFKPQFPYMIVSMLVGSIFAFALSSIMGANVTKIASVGALPVSLPPLSAPDFSLENIKLLAPAALATTLFALTEALSIARSLADKTGQNLDANQEFVGQGLSNIVGCFFSGYVATGSFNRSGLNYQAGAKTPLAAIFAGSFLIILVVLVAPLAAYLPNAAMAGILFLVAWGLIDFRHIRKILHESLYETLILGTTFFSALFLELEFAIFLGVMLSLVLYLKRTSHPRLRIRVPDPRKENRSFSTDPTLPECPQLRIIRIEGSLYFGAVNHIRETLNKMLLENPEQKNILLMAHKINLIDMAGAELLVRLAEERKKDGGGLHIYHINEGVCDHYKLMDNLLKIGDENIYETKREAISQIFNQLDKDICTHCKARIFLECLSIAPNGSEPGTCAEEYRNRVLTPVNGKETEHLHLPG